MNANSGADTNVAAIPTNSSKTNKKVSNTSFEINKTVSNIMQTPGGVKRISAAVFVAGGALGLFLLVRASRRETDRGAS